jgi:hypothetical protein
MFPDLPTTNVCVWWQNETFKWCVAPAYADTWTQVSFPHHDKADAQAYALDHYEQVRFFDGLPDDLDPDTWDR